MPWRPPAQGGAVARRGPPSLRDNKGEGPSTFPSLPLPPPSRGVVLRYPSPMRSLPCLSVPQQAALTTRLHGSTPTATSTNHIEIAVSPFGVQRDHIARHFSTQHDCPRAHSFTDSVCLDKQLYLVLCPTPAGHVVDAYLQFLSGSIQRWRVFFFSRCTSFSPSLHSSGDGCLLVREMPALCSPAHGRFSASCLPHPSFPLIPPAALPGISGNHTIGEPFPHLRRDAR